MEENTCKISRWEILKQQLNNLEPEAFQQAISEGKEHIVLDVRTEAEYASGHLPNAINISYLAYDFWDRIEQLDPNAQYYVYCRSGRRSVRTCTLMKNGGFKNIFNLDGGLNAWPTKLDALAGDHLQNSN